MQPVVFQFHLSQGRPTAAKEDRAGFPPDRVLFYAAEVLLGLEHIHSFDVVYRDLKPNNILLDGEGRVRSAAWLQPWRSLFHLTESGHVRISDMGLSVKLRPGKVLRHLAGTAGYWAPEIVAKTGTYKVRAAQSRSIVGRLSFPTGIRLLELWGVYL